jgi:hypothetical protein
MHALVFDVGDLVWSMLWFTLFFMWIWLVIVVFSDVFRSQDLSGWGKALWSVFIIFLPYLGVFVYLIARGGLMNRHSQEEAQRQEDATRHYIQDVAHSSPAEEISRLAELRSSGAITEEEFQGAKAKALA